jgi:CheY-like chemotaxis protein
MSIDDDQVTLMLNEIILESAEFCLKIVKASNGKEALEFFTTQQSLNNEAQSLPELVLLDLNMPVINGWEFLAGFAENFQQFHHKVQIVILSSSFDPEEEKRARKNPMVLDFIHKSLSVESLNCLKLHEPLKKYFMVGC